MIGIEYDRVHPTEIRTSISPSSVVELNTTSALANYATEAGLSTNGDAAVRPSEVCVEVGDAVPSAVLIVVVLGLGVVAVFFPNREVGHPYNVQRRTKVRRTPAFGGI
uniref:Uncharacterized protein n=1 Tax=Timema bartmani TaxID=61472 RepID=A0A7R9I659_9NEOP|nr:unnamed protein product [Timema bartmani]